MYSKKSIFTAILFLNSILLGASILPHSALAVVAPQVVVRDPAYSATLMSQSVPDPITIPAGTSKTVTFTFKNTGTATWNSTGNKFISGHTMNPREHKSIFFASDWITAKQTGKISGTIKPGQTGKLTLTFKVPATTKVGEYTEQFYLAAENYSWVKNGHFFVKIKVAAAPKTPSSNTSTNSSVGTSTPPASVESTANRVFLSPKTVSAVGGEPITVRFGYQNTGKAVWTSGSIEQNGITNFADTTWVNRQKIFNRSIEISSGSFWRDEFVFRAPAKAGTYETRFMVNMSGGNPTSATITIPVTVTSDAPSGYTEPFSDTPAPGYSFLNEVARLATEPRIRVGLWKDPVNGVVSIQAVEDDYSVVDATGTLGTWLRGQNASMKFVNGVYTFQSDTVTVSSTSFIRVEPLTNPHAIITVGNLERKVSGKSYKNFNKYRGALELRQAQDQNNSLYLINDLHFEDYMTGMGENSNASPLEYLKAQAVVQRTYAYVVQNTSKHDSRFFDVVASTGDQLYLGANNEPDMPRFIDAVNATRGLMVTYNNDVVITPYFGNSDGTTRAWSQVWGGNKPWLISVPATYDERDNKKMFGHGVGMSQRDAAIRAEEEHLDWVQLVKYYYTGVEIHKIY